MQNVTDALIMAGQALIFIVALTVCISSFSTVRVSIDNIIGQTDTVRYAKSDAGYINFIESDNKNAIRVVNSGEVVSSMYRSMKENFVIFVKFNGNISFNENVITCKAKEDIKLGENKIISKGDNNIVIVSTGTLSSNEISGFELNLTSKGIFLNNYDIKKMFVDGEFYSKIEKLKFYEYLGEYKQDSAEGVAAENKGTFRVITYIQTD